MDNIQLPAEVRDHKTLEMTAACDVTAPQHFSTVRGEKQQLGDMGLGSEKRGSLSRTSVRVTGGALQKHS